MVLCGRQAADWDAGQVGSGVAEILGLKSITLAKKIAIQNDKARVERVVENGYDIIDAALPILITVSNEVGTPRYPTIKGIMMAKKKEPVVWKASDIGLDAAKLGKRSKLVKIYQPVHEVHCEIINGETPEEAGANLAIKLREARLL
jgi:electron transfer flavoprotein beta subunit